MKLNDLGYLAIFTIAVTASGVLSETEKKQLTQDKGKKIAKRETILIDSLPIESSYQPSPKVIYQRVSRQKYIKSKPRHASPRPRYGPPKSRRPIKKYRGKPVKPKYNSHTKKRPQKPTYGPPKPPKRKPIYGPPKQEKYQSSYVPQEPVGFGEPPMDFNDYQPHNNYEPSTDSYGASLKPNLGNEYSSPGYAYDQPAASTYNKGYDHFNNHYQPNYQQQWQKDQRYSYNDNAHAHSQKYVNKVKPMAFNSPPFKDEHFDDYADEEQDAFNKFYNHRPYAKEVKKPPMYEHAMYVNRPRKPIKPTTNNPMIVGGQYAEPPAKYIQKYQPNYAGDEYNGAKGFADSETAGSSVSSYVNYKNSNMAFSPQNLNDAFSIID